MKFIASFFLAVLLKFSAVQGAIVKTGDTIPASSEAGLSLLNKAQKRPQYRFLEDRNFQDATHLAGYSLRFEGCYMVNQWNDDARDDQDVRLLTKRLARFRMCPSDSCMGNKNACKSDYGDYVIDMEEFLESYFDLLGIQNDSYQCQKLEYNNNNGRRRRLAYYDVLDDDRYVNQEYYVGPYCAGTGGIVQLGVFLDDTCTLPVGGDYSMKAADEVYQSITGYSLNTQDLISDNCLNCVYNGEVSNFCEELYMNAGKCEAKMNYRYPLNDACSFLNSLQALRNDGFFMPIKTTNHVATFFIVLFAFTTAGAAYYVYFLQSKVKSMNVSTYFYD